MTTIPIQDGKLRLHSFISGETQERVTTSLTGFAPEWEGECLYVIDWKLNPETKTGRLTYQTKNDLYAPIHDVDLPMVVDRYKLSKPSKSKNWTWDSYSDSWRNTRTGERVRVY
jgi:hypothetical protein